MTLGATSLGLRFINIPEEILNRFGKVSGLCLKPYKRILILITSLVSLNNIVVTRDWLRRHCPNWVSFQMSNSGQYLGLYMGPETKALQWKATWFKFKARMAEDIWLSLFNIPPTSPSLRTGLLMQLWASFYLSSPTSFMFRRELRVSNSL